MQLLCCGWGYDNHRGWGCYNWCQSDTVLKLVMLWQEKQSGVKRAAGCFSLQECEAFPSLQRSCEAGWMRRLSLFVLIIVKCYGSAEDCSFLLIAKSCWLFVYACTSALNMTFALKLNITHWPFMAWYQMAFYSYCGLQLLLCHEKTCGFCNSFYRVCHRIMFEFAGLFYGAEGGCLTDQGEGTAFLLKWIWSSLDFLRWQMAFRLKRQTEKLLSKRSLLSFQREN